MRLTVKSQEQADQAESIGHEEDANLYSGAQQSTLAFEGWENHLASNWREEERTVEAILDSEGHQREDFSFLGDLWVEGWAESGGRNGMGPETDLDVKR